MPLVWDVVGHHAAVPMSDYVRWLRAFVGHDLLLLPAVAVVPRDSDGRILLVRHVDTGLWGLVGGTVEVGESPANAALREAAEEVGLDMTLGPLVAAVGGPGYEVQYPGGDRVAYVAAVFEASVREPAATPDGEEVDEAGWFALDELDGVNLNDFARTLLTEIGYLSPAAR